MLSAFFPLLRWLALICGGHRAVGLENLAVVRQNLVAAPVDTTTGVGTGSFILTPLIVGLRALVLICRGHRAVALENLALRPTGWRCSGAQ
jgi:hypothetical protein